MGRNRDGIEEQGKQPSAAEGVIVDRTLSTSARDATDVGFGILVDRYYARVAVYLYRLVGDRELAAELTQDTFLAAYEALHRLSDDQAFSAWLYRIALYQATPVLRRRKVLHFVPLEQIAHAVGSWIGHAPSEHEAAVERDLIQEVLERLAHEQRVVLLLHSLAGFTSEEVARIVGGNPRSVERQLSRARERFRELYDELNQGD